MCSTTPKIIGNSFSALFLSNTSSTALFIVSAVESSCYVASSYNERSKTRMKERMARHYNEKAYNDASQQTKDHRRLHHSNISRRKLMPREVQRSIWRLNMRCPTYSQVTTGQPLRCRWCDKDYNSVIAWLLYIGKN